MNSIGKRIADARKRAGLRQVELAAKLGVSPGAVGQWEAGISRPTKHAVALMATLNMQPEDLMDDQERAMMKGGAKFIEKLAANADFRKKFHEARLPAEAILRKTISRMPAFDNPEIPLAGTAAADEQEGREWEHPEPGSKVKADALEPRTITVRGASAEDLARDGQQVVIDASVTNVAVGELCVVLTKDGLLRLKRKMPDAKGQRRYGSINREFRPFEVHPRQVVAEFPVATVLIKAKTRSPVETVDEGFPS
ncbi:MAG TPA: helix-turn-helix domain-containing protein [Planctomycetota bacterium]|jgi:transcriptional regulator with XRE-family HTH domain